MGGDGVSGTVYDEHARFYIDFIDRALAEEPSFTRRLLEIMERLLGDKLSGARVCDVACGEGYVSRFLIGAGAREVVGVDSSVILIEEAERRTDATGVTYEVGDAHDLKSHGDSSFDICVSQMALMDIADHRATFNAIARVLKPGGAFVFSLLHPCFEARPFHLPDEPPYVLDEDGIPTAVLVRRYGSEGHFRTGGVGVRGHMGSYHRMLSTYLNDLIDAGFRLDRLEEPLFDVPGLWSEVPRVLVVSSTLVADR